MKSWTIYFVAMLFLGGLIMGAPLVINSIADRAASAARAERDAHWQAEIARSNAEHEQAMRRATEKAAAADAAAQDQIEALERENQTLEKDNDALPDDGHCGLGRGRVQLLNR